MEFLNDSVADALAPTDSDLSTYLKANPGAFEIAPMLAFQQVFLNPDRYGHRIDQDAASILDVLMTSPATDPARSAMPRCFLRNLCSPPRRRSAATHYGEPPQS
jgi:hypothetical protein